MITSFFNRLKNLEKKALENSLQENEVGTKKIEALITASKKGEKDLENKVKRMDTPYDCLKSVLDE